jgi:hypothetical protein
MYLSLRGPVCVRIQNIKHALPVILSMLSLGGLEEEEEEEEEEE